MEAAFASFFCHVSFSASLMQGESAAVLLDVLPRCSGFGSTACCWFPATTFKLRRRGSAWRWRAYAVPEHGYDLYELLGVDSTASRREIRRSYRWLQKKCHPDVAGDVGHDMAILLNAAYATLVDPAQRAAYDQLRARSVQLEGFTGLPLYSKWFGQTDEERAIFVDETRCVGCLKCALIASQTFAIETRYGRARAVGQWADPESLVRDAIKACPVDCISWVDRSKLAALEFIMSKQPRLPVGIDGFNSGGIRTADVFQAADQFLKKQKVREQQTDSRLRETPAQLRARLAAMEAIQERAGRWWYRFVSKKMSDDVHYSKHWDSKSARASQAAIVPSSYFECVSKSMNNEDNNPYAFCVGDGRHKQESSFPPELDRLFEAAERRREGIPKNESPYEEYWVPTVDSPVPYSTPQNTSKPGKGPRNSPSYKWSWTESSLDNQWSGIRDLRMDYKVNMWVKRVFSALPLVISAVAAMLVGFSGGTYSALSETEVAGPLPSELTGSLGMQVLLAAAAWYTLAAAFSGAAMLILSVNTVDNQQS